MNRSNNASSSQRVMPFRAREDLIIDEIAYQGTGYCVIKDPVALKYFRLQPEQFFVLQQLNGKCNLEDLKQRIVAAYPWIWITLRDIQQMVSDLHGKGLLVTDRAGQGFALVRKKHKDQRKQWMQQASNLITIRFPGWDCDGFLSRLLPLARWCLRPVSILLAFAFVAACWLSVLVHFDDFRTQMPTFYQFFSGSNLLYLWGVMVVTKCVHELGHGLACKHFGCNCNQMGIMLMAFSPTLYCDVTDSWMLHSKWKRMAIAMAGVYFELILSAIAILVWWQTPPGLVHNLALNVIFVTSVSTIVMNANPLMKFDGYYALADYLEIPNMRSKASKLLRDNIYWWCLGVEKRTDPFMPRASRGWFIAYAVGSSAYQWIVMLGITLFLYNVLAPYGLQNLGLVVGLVAIGTMIGGMSKQTYQVIVQPRELPLDRRKISVTTLALVGSLLLAALIPIPRYASIPFAVEPTEARAIYATVPGRLSEILIAPSDYCQEGDLLFKLENEELSKQLEQLRSERDEVVVKAKVEFMSEAYAKESLTRHRLHSLEEQIDEFESEILALEVRAPSQGYILPPPPRAPNQSDEAMLGEWEDTPLHQHNLGCAIEEGTHLLSLVASPEPAEIALYVDQNFRHQVSEGQEIRLQFEDRPGQYFRAMVQEISVRPIKKIPKSLSNKHGGSIPTTSNTRGEEEVQSVMFQVKASLKKPVGDLQTGIRGHAQLWLPGKSLLRRLLDGFQDQVDLQL